MWRKESTLASDGRGRGRDRDEGGSGPAPAAGDPRPALGHHLHACGAGPRGASAARAPAAARRGARRQGQKARHRPVFSTLQEKAFSDLVRREVAAEADGPLAVAGLFDPLDAVPREKGRHGRPPPREALLPRLARDRAVLRRGWVAAHLRTEIGAHAPYAGGARRKRCLLLRVKLFVKRRTRPVQAGAAGPRVSGLGLGLARVEIPLTACAPVLRSKVVGAPLRGVAQGEARGRERKAGGQGLVQ